MQIVFYMLGSHWNSYPSKPHEKIEPKKISSWYENEIEINVMEVQKKTKKIFG